MNIELGRGAKPLDEGHRAGLGMGQAGLVNYKQRSRGRGGSPAILAKATAAGWQTDAAAGWERRPPIGVPARAGSPVQPDGPQSPPCGGCHRPGKTLGGVIESRRRKPESPY
jgi:hypothetical protein